MREIKFKAFHKITGKLFDVYSFTDKEVFEYSFDGIYTSPTLPAKREDCELMQFTGLKDKSNNEIYEGDILKAFKPNTWLKGSDLFEVRFNEVEAKFAYWCYRMNNWTTNGSGKLFNIGNNKNGSWCEIIGNIHQNKGE